MKARSALPWVALGLVLLGLAALVGAPTGRSNRPLDPAANGPDGAKAVVLLLRELGATVTVERGAPSRGTGTALLLEAAEDRRGDADALRDWVEAGGTLVVADPSSPLASTQGELRPCPPALVTVGTIGPVDGSDRRGRGEDCFGGAVRATAVGAGTVVVVAGPDLFTNRRLGDHDNAVLAAALLAPTGGEAVAFLRRPVGGDTALLDLLGPRVVQALAQLAVAFALYVLWRGRRLGRPVVEPQPVLVAGSELVTAVGRILDARRQPAEAAARVRAATRRALEQRLGVRRGGPVEVLADAVAARTGADARTVADTLAHRPVATDGDLVAVLAALDALRDRTLGPAAPAADRHPGGTP